MNEGFRDSAFGYFCTYPEEKPTLRAANSLLHGI
jgi:hypothetical protein